MLSFQFVLLFVLFQVTCSKITTCSSKLCNNEGICIQGALKYFRCECFEQYFTGERCEEQAMGCLSDYLGVCSPAGTQSCNSYFGGMDCMCKHGYEGRFCEYHTGAGYVKDAKSPAIYVSQQPPVSEETDVIIAFAKPEDTIIFTVAMYNTIFNLTVDNFTQTKDLWSVLQPKEAAWPTFYTQNYFHKMKVRFQHPIRFNLSLTLINKGSKFVSKHNFDVSPVVPTNEGACFFDIRFRGGVCSINSFWFPRLAKGRRYKIMVEVVPTCNEEFYNYTVKYDYYIPYNDDDVVGVFSKIKNRVIDPGSYRWPIWNYHIVGRTKAKVWKKYGVLADKPYVIPGYDECWVSTRYSTVYSVKIFGGKHLIFDYDDPIFINGSAEHPDMPNSPEIFDYNWTCHTKNFDLWPNEEWLSLQNTTPCDWVFDKAVSNSPIIQGFEMRNTGTYEITLTSTLKQWFIDKYLVVNAIPISANIELRIEGLKKRPILGIKCLQNCDTNDQTRYLVDKMREIHLEVFCILRCDQLTYKWYSIGLEYTNHNFYFDQGVEDSKLIIRPNVITNQKEVTIIVMSTSGGEAVAILKILTIELDSSEIPHLLCPDHVVTMGEAHNTQFDSCTRVKDLTLALTYRVYQKLWNIHTDRGVMVAWGNVPYYKDLLLAPNNEIMSSITTVVSTSEGNEFEFVTYYQVGLPTSKQFSQNEQLQIVLDNYYGNSRNISSMAFCIQSNQVSVIIRKMSFLRQQIAHLERSKELEYNMYLLTLYRGFVREVLEGFKGKIEFDIFDEVFQIATWIHSELSQTLKPIATEISIMYAHILKRISFTYFDTINKNRAYYRQVAFRTFDKLITTLKDIDTITENPIRGGIIELTDGVSAQVNRWTKFEIQLSHEEDKAKEEYPQYSAIISHDKTTLAQYTELTTTAWSAGLKLVQALGVLAGFTIDNPILTTLKQLASGLSIYDMLVYRNTAENIIGIPFYFSTYSVIRIWKLSYDAYIWTTVYNDTLITLKSIATHLQPLWWNPIGQGSDMYGFLVEIHDYETQELIKADFELSFGTDRLIRKFVRGRAIQISSDKTTLQLMAVHYTKIDVDIAETVVIEFKMNINDSLMVVPIVNRDPIYTDYDSKEMVRVGAMYKTNLVVPRIPENRTVPFTLHIGIQPEQNRAVPYELAVYSVKCSEWKEDTRNGIKSYYPKFINGSVQEDGKLLCNFSYTNVNTQNIVLYSASWHAIENVARGFIPIEFHFNMHDEQIIFIFTSLLTLIFTFLYFLGRLYDLEDNKKKHALYLVDNRPGENYAYVIIVITGPYARSGTTSHIGIKVYGSRLNSKRHILIGPTSQAVLQRRSADWFVMTTSENMGHVKALEVWSDYRGYAPDWYCEKIIIRDYVEMQEWVFMVEKWFSLIYGDRKLHRIIYQKMVEPLSRLKSIFHAHDFIIYHLWFGMLVQEHCNVLTRRHKVMTVWCILCTTMYFLMIMIGISEWSGNTLMDYGEIQPFYGVWLGIVALLLAISVNYPLQYIYTNAAPTRHYSNEYQDISGLDPCEPVPEFPLPYHCRFIVMTIRVIVICYCVFHLFQYGFTFGRRKSYTWMVAMVFIIFLDAFILETIHVIVRAYVWRIIKEKKDPQRFCNELIGLNYQDQIQFATITNKKLLFSPDMYKPVRRGLRKILYHKETTFAAFRKICIETILYFVYTGGLYLMITAEKDDFSYYTKHTLKLLVVDAYYTKTLAMDEISSDEDLQNYLNHTIIHVLHWSMNAYLAMSNFKLLGVARLRQLRLGSTNCFIPDELIMTYGEYCLGTLRASNLQTKSFNPGWKPRNHSDSNTISDHREIRPFRFQTAEESGSSGTISDSGTLPGGGYVAWLGRSKINTRYTLNYLRDSKWFDIFTRVIFIEFSTYNPHAELFNIVKLGIQKQASGDWVVLHEIRTLKFVEDWSAEDLRELFGILIVVASISFLVYKHINILQSRSFYQYLTELWNCIDLIASVAAIISLFFIQQRRQILFEVLKAFEMSSYNMYTNFIHVTSMDYISNAFAALNVFITTLRIARVLEHYSQFRLAQYTLSYAFGGFVTLIFLLLMVNVAFATLFHLVLGPHLIQCSTFFGSFTLIIGLTYGLARELNNEVLAYGGQLMYTLYIIYFATMRIFLLNLFVSVLIVSFSKCRRRMERETSQFSFYDFFVERLLFRRGKSERIRYTFH